MKILVTGDRNWRDAYVINESLERMLDEISYKEDDPEYILVHGEAMGADIIADVCAQLQQEWEIKRYPADWSLGKRAGVLRNQQMLDENPDIALVLVFHSNLANSKGTADMVRRAKAAGIEVRIFDGTN